MYSVPVGDEQSALCNALSQDRFPHCLEEKTSQSLEKGTAGKLSLPIRPQAFVSPVCRTCTWGRALCLFVFEEDPCCAHSEVPTMTVTTTELETS